MTASTATLAPETACPVVSGPGALAELEASFTLARQLDVSLGAGSRGTAARTAIERAACGDVDGWLSHVRAAAGCSNPIRLSGTIDRVDPATGAVLSRQSTQDMPDGVLYKSCGNRRSAVCPHCAEVYRRDAFQLIRAGMIGGKGVDTHVSTRPAVFATFTAPSFGLVHGVRTSKNGKPMPCHPGRHPILCPHGVDLRCATIHGKTDRVNGEALCPDCYDYDHQAVWNHVAGELWRRTTEGIRKYFGRLTRRAGLGTVKANCCKVAEFQARGVVHYHAVFRLDGIDPDTGETINPPAGLDVVDLHDAIRYATRGTHFTTSDHPAHPGGWLIEWGQHPSNPEVRPVQLRGDQEVTDSLVAGYLAKYATKSTEATGHVSRRLNSDTVDLYNGQDPRLTRPPTHTERLVDACWTLGEHPDWQKLRRWAHMLGFGGHFLTKSRRYSITFRLLRNTRVIWRRTVETDPATDTDDDTTLIVGTLTYSGTGWRTLGDAMLANTSAAMARERRRVGREELAAEQASQT